MVWGQNIRKPREEEEEEEKEELVMETEVWSEKKQKIEGNIG